MSNDYEKDIVYEKTETGYSAYVRSLPGVGVAAQTREEAERLIHEAIAFHLEPLEPPAADFFFSFNPDLPAGNMVFVRYRATVGIEGLEGANFGVGRTVEQNPLLATR